MEENKELLVEETAPIEIVMDKNSAPIAESELVKLIQEITDGAQAKTKVGITREDKSKTKAYKKIQKKSKKTNRLKTRHKKTAKEKKSR